MKIRRMTTLGEIYTHFRKNAVAFQLTIDMADGKPVTESFLIGALEWLVGTSKGDVIRIDDDDLKILSTDTLVEVEDNFVYWQPKHLKDAPLMSYYKLEFYGGEPMKIA